MSVLADVQTSISYTGGARAAIRLQGTTFLYIDGVGSTRWGGVTSSTVGHHVGGTLGFTVSAGTTAQRPSSPATGMLRYNTTDGRVECYRQDTSTWEGLGAVENGLTPHRRVVSSDISGASYWEYTLLEGLAGFVLHIGDVTAANTAAEMWMRFYIDGVLRTDLVYDWSGRGYRADAWNGAWEMRNCNKGGTGTTNESGIAISPYGKIGTTEKSNWTLWVLNASAFSAGRHVQVWGVGNYGTGYRVLTEVQGRCRASGHLTGVRIFTSEGSNFTGGTVSLFPLHWS